MININNSAKGEKVNGKFWEFFMKWVLREYIQKKKDKFLNNYLRLDPFLIQADNEG